MELKQGKFTLSRCHCHSLDRSPLPTQSLSPFTSSLLRSTFAVFHDPIKSVFDTFIIRGAARLNLPLPVANRVQIEPFSDLGRCLGIHQVLFVCVNEDGNSDELFFQEEFIQ